MNQAVPNTKVMGILNVTPDSFSDGGQYFATATAVQKARLLWEEGADIIDIGGESTRPNAKRVSAQEQCRRVIPVIEKIKADCPVPISIDTSHPEVMQAALQAGATMINDVRALTEPGAMAYAASVDVPICLMHMQGQPETMQNKPEYQDIIQDVLAYLSERIDACCTAGIDKQRLIIDPGFGFGKTDTHNLQCIKFLNAFHALGCPVLLGVSRKSTIGRLTGLPAGERLGPSLVLAALGLLQGVNILRVHDVAQTRHIIKLMAAYIDVKDSL